MYFRKSKFSKSVPLFSDFIVFFDLAKALFFGLICEWLAKISNWLRVKPFLFFLQIFRSSKKIGNFEFFFRFVFIRKFFCWKVFWNLFEIEDVAIYLFISPRISLTPSNFSISVQTGDRLTVRIMRYFIEPVWAQKGFLANFIFVFLLQNTLRDSKVIRVQYMYVLFLLAKWKLSFS